MPRDADRWPLDHTTVELADGRRVAYCTLGEPDAPVVVYCHGTPGSRWELLLARSALERSRVAVRLVALDRPGYGTSTFVAQPGFLPWARDLAEVLDRLGIGHVAVLGASGGSPFALGCARALGDRVTRVAIVAGVAPPDTPGMQDAAALADESASDLVRRLRYGGLSLAARMGLTPWLVRRLVASLGPADRTALDHPRLRAALGRVVREAYAQGGRAAAHEAGLFMRPWDLDLSQVSQEARVWHGDRDTRIPAGVGVSLANRLPRASCVVWPRHGHFSWTVSDDVADIARFTSGRPLGAG